MDSNAPIMKFGRIKRQHGRVEGLDPILDRIVKQCPFVSRIVPGRIKVRRGNSSRKLKLQYETPAGLKCLYLGAGTVQEVFIICTDKPKATQWLKDQELIESA
jgi:hypothetical protein